MLSFNLGMLVVFAKTPLNPYGYGFRNPFLRT